MRLTFKEVISDREPGVDLSHFEMIQTLLYLHVIVWVHMGTIRRGDRVLEGSLAFGHGGSHGVLVICPRRRYALVQRFPLLSVGKPEFLLRPFCQLEFAPCDIHRMLRGYGAAKRRSNQDLISPGFGARETCI